MRAISPLRWLFRLVSDRITTWIVGEARDADHLLRMSEFRSLVADIEEQGLVSATDRVLIYNLLEAGSTEIEYIMTPRTQTNFVGADTSIADAADELLKHRRMRVPAYEDNLDQVVGFVHAEDVAKVVQGQKQASVCRDILRPALQVPLTKTVDEMLDFFQHHDERAAMVINEFGGISGIITMEDVLNFVFGEITGDFIDPASFAKEGEQVYVVPGDLKLADFEALTNFGLEDRRMTTIGGVALRHRGQLPQAGDVATMENVRITVLEKESQRIKRLRAEKISASSGEAEKNELASRDGKAPAKGGRGY